jgi:hypothetical protein
MGEKATATAIENNHNPPAEAMAALATAIENNHNPPVEAMAAAVAHGAMAAAVAPPPEPPAAPPIFLPFNIPGKPDPIKGQGSKSQIRDQIKVHKQEGKFDLLKFGPTWGRCPYCGGYDIVGTTVNDKVKLIRTLKMPRFVQGMGMKCIYTDCTGKGWQTVESTYVATLPPRDQKALNAQVAGAADGICMDAVVQMRVGVNASALENTSRANLTRWHTQLKDEYKRYVRRRVWVLWKSVMPWLMLLVNRLV